MASIDGDGQVMCREIECPDNLLCQFAPQDDHDNLGQPEYAKVLFNRVDSTILFVSVNNVLLQY